MRLRSFPLGYAVLALLVCASVVVMAWGLSQADGRTGTAGPVDVAVVVPGDSGPERAPGGTEYEQFLQAAVEHPHVAHVFAARYADRFGPDVPADRIARGLVAFRDHYRRAVARTTPRDARPATAAMLRLNQEHALAQLLINNRTLRDQVDRDVERAVRGR